MPTGLRRLIQKHAHILNMRTASWIAKDPYANDPPESSYESRYPWKLGIIKAFRHNHWPYIAACRELGVAYKLLDISGPDWLEVLKKSACNAFLVWPSVTVSVWKQMFDERLRTMTHDLNLLVFPSYAEAWVYESKRRMHYWLAANGVPHPQTWVFYDLKEALAFGATVRLPIVYKSDLGSGASGVRVFRNRRRLLQHIRRCFQRGFTTYRRGPRDKEWGFVLLQEYLPDVREWRIVRVGDSYFGYEKLKRGEYHSGSLERRYVPLAEELLSFADRILDMGPFYSMDLDIFETTDRRYLVNELQTMFGTSRSEMYRQSNEVGRLIRKANADSWVFEPGDFSRNACCNLRVLYLLQMLAANEGSAQGVTSGISNGV